MKYLIKFMIACTYKTLNLFSKYLSLALYVLWHFSLPKYEGDALIRKNLEDKFFYVDYFFKSSIHCHVYKTFWDFVKGKYVYHDGDVTIEDL